MNFCKPLGTLILAAVVSGASAAIAQEPVKTPRVGFLHSGAAALRIYSAPAIATRYDD